MGVKTFSTVFKKLGTLKLGKLRNAIIVVDAYLEIYRTCYGMSFGATLRDAQGRPTGYINSLMQLMIKMKKGNNIQIWVFDSTARNRLKEAELAKRAQRRGDAMDQIEELKDDGGDGEEDEEKEEKIGKLKMRQVMITEAMVNNIKFVLNCLGIRHMTAPDGYEGEHLCACVARKYEDDHKAAVKLWHGEYPEDGEPPATFVMTRDPDALLYGAPRIMQKVPRKTGEYEITDLADIIQKTREELKANYDLEETFGTDDLETLFDRPMLIRACIALGVDICPSGKIQGIGPKTVVAKTILGLEFDDCQEEAFARFTEECPAPAESVKKKISEDSLHKLEEWLVDDKSFNQKRVSKMLSGLIEPEEE